MFRNQIRICQTSTSPTYLLKRSQKLVIHLKLSRCKLESTLSMDSQPPVIVRSTNFHTRALQHIRPFLSKYLANTIASELHEVRGEIEELLTHIFNES